MTSVNMTGHQQLNQLRLPAPEQIVSFDYDFHSLAGELAGLMKRRWRLLTT